MFASWLFRVFLWKGVLIFGRNRKIFAFIQTKYNYIILKSKIEMFDNHFKVKRVLTLLGLPSSFEEIEIPYNDITSITFTKKLYKAWILFGLLVIILGLAVIANSPGISLLALLLGTYQLLNFYVGVIQIRQSFNKLTSIEIAVFELEYAKQLIEQLPYPERGV